MKQLLAILLSCLLITDVGAQVITPHESRCVNNGYAVISGTVGAGGPFQVSISSGPPEYVNPGVHVANAFPDTIDALYPGVYTLRVVDQNGAEFNSPFTVTGNYVLPGNSDYAPTATAVSNCANPNGSIQGALSNGRAPYTYTIISGPAQIGTTNNTGTFTGLPAGSYNVQAADSCQNIQTRNVTVTGVAASFTLSNPVVNRVTCDSFVLTALTITPSLPAGGYYQIQAYHPNGEPSKFYTSTTLPIGFSTFRVDDIATGFVQIRVFDACGNSKTIQPGVVANDWAFTDADVTQTCASGLQLNGVTTSGTITSPFIITVRPFYTNNNGADIFYTAAQTVTGYPYTVTGVTNATNPLKLLTTITDACGVTKTIIKTFSFSLNHASSVFVDCNNTRVTANPVGAYTLPITYFATLLDGTIIASNSTGIFDWLDGSYRIYATDACGKTTANISVNPVHNWQTTLSTYTDCDVNDIKHLVTIPRLSIGNVNVYQYQGGLPVTGASVLLSSQVYNLGGNSQANATTTAGITDFIFATQPNLTYSYVVIDSCGKSDTVSVTNGAAVKELLTHKSRVVNKCINKGNILGSYQSFSSGNRNVIIVVWNINTPGTILHNAGYGNMSPERVLVTDAPLGKYVIRYKLEYCANVTVYDTVEVSAYVQPTILTAQSFAACAGGGTPVAITPSNGVGPFTYEIINSNPNHYTAAVQASNIFVLPSTESSVTVRITDACLNSTTRTVAIVRAANPVVRSTPVALATCTLPFNFNLYTDSVYSGAVFQWTKITGTNAGSTILSNRPFLPITYNSITDTGTYQVNITVPNTCFNVNAVFNVANIAITCLPSVSGNVFNDVTGLTDSTVNGNPADTASGTQLYVSLIQNGAVVSTTAVMPNGTYSFTGVADGDYTIVINTNAAGSITPSLPAGWMNTGEDCCDGIGSDGLTDGIVSITMAGAGITSANFGIQQPPTAVSGILPMQTNPGDTISVAVASTYFQGIDLNGGTITHINIVSFPSNASSITINGISYTVATFPATGVTIPADENGNPSQPIAIDPIDGSVTSVFEYTVTDNASTESTNGIIEIPFNDIPFANTDIVTTNEDTSVTIPVLTNDTFSGDGPSTGTITVTTQPTNGTATVNDGGTPDDPSDDQIVYTPNPDFSGSDTLIYQICDASFGGGTTNRPTPDQITSVGDCDTAMLIITVNEVNDLPVAITDIATTDEEVPVTIPVLTNDTFGGDGPSTGTITVTTQPTNGTATVNDGGTPDDPTDDHLVYIPNPDFTGNDTLIYQICDAATTGPGGGGGSSGGAGGDPGGRPTFQITSVGDCDTAMVIITVNGVNDLPVATTDMSTTDEDAPVTIPVLTNDTFGGDGPSTGTITVTTQPTNGTATVNDGGTPTDPTDDQVVYTPNNNFSGTDSLIYQVCDNNGDCDTALVIITINPVNDLPIAVADTATTDENTPVTIPVLTNDTFGGDGPSTGTITVTTQPTNGTATVNDGGTPTDPTDDQVAYTPNPDFNGSDSLIYQVCDNNGDCDTALVIITITPAAQPLFISGNVYNDANGLTDNTVNGNPTNVNDSLFVHLVSNGVIIATTPVASDGTYSFNNIAAGIYTVVINTSSIADSTPSLPAGWINTGENISNAAGNDGSTNGVVNNIELTTSGISNVNFGIELLPLSYNQIEIIPDPAGGDILPGTVTVNVNGMDSEDGTLIGSTQTITITTLPGNAIMVYNDTAVTVGQQISNFNPLLLSFTDITNGADSITFNFVFEDAAGQTSVAPATYTLLWNTPVPVKLYSFTATATGCNTVTAKWMVGETAGLSRFELQRSVPGHNFTTAGSTNFDQHSDSYIFKDSELPTEGYNYRLKMINKDGSFIYGPTVFVRLNCNNYNVMVYPNPAKDLVQISGIKPGYTLQLLSTNGQLLLKKQATASTQEINLSGFSQQVFILAVYNKANERVQIIKVIKTL